MSTTKIYPFDTAGNFNYTGTSIKVESGSTSLVLQDYPSQTFEETYTDDTDYTYTASEVEFVPSSPLVAYGTFETDGNADFDSAYGSKTGSILGDDATATVSGGFVNLTNSDYTYVDWTFETIGMTNTGTIDFTVKPNYSGNPANNQYLMVVAEESGSDVSFIRAVHLATGGVLFHMKDSSGADIFSFTAGAWSPTSGTSYLFSINFDVTPVTGGATRLFIDGVQLGATKVDTGVRTTTCLLRTGTNNTPVITYPPNFSIGEIVLYDTVQHTANYTPAALVPNQKLQQKLQVAGDFDYIESYVESPIQTANGAVDGTLISVQSWTEVSSSNVQYTFNTAASVAYWYNAVSGAWELSDKTYAQSSTATQIETYLSEFPFPPATLQFRYGIVFPNGSVSEYTDTLNVEYTHQIYSTTNPVISVATASRIWTEEMLTAAFDETKTGTDEIKYIMVVSGTKKYWSGAEWATSNGTYSQSNTASEVSANITDLLGTRVTFGFDALLHSETGLTTPSLNTATFTYDAALEDPSTLPRLVDINGYLLGANGPLSGMVVQVRPYLRGFNNPNTGLGGGGFHVYDWTDLEASVSDGYFSDSCYLQPGGEYWEFKIGKQRYKTQLLNKDSNDINELTFEEVD